MMRVKNRSQSPRPMFILRQKLVLLILGAAGQLKGKTSEVQNPRRHLQKSSLTPRHHKSRDGRQENPGVKLCPSLFIVWQMLPL
jgi:hypothetical protein